MRTDDGHFYWVNNNGQAIVPSMMSITYLQNAINYARRELAKIQGIIEGDIDVAFTSLKISDREWDLIDSIKEFENELKQRQERGEL